MRASILTLIISVALLSPACATREEWATWRDHPVHFASAGHLGFSLRNREGSAPRVRRDEVVTASTEAWWGTPIAVAQEQILER